MSDALVVIRDIAIILLAIESLVIGLLLLVLALQIRSLAKMLEQEIKPILDSANETLGTVRGTTSFVSQTVVVPLVRVASFASAVRGVIRALRRPKGQ